MRFRLATIFSPSLFSAAALGLLLIGNTTPGSADELTSASYRHRAGAFVSSSAAGANALTSSSPSPAFGSSGATVGAVPTAEPIGSTTTLVSLLPGFWSIVVGRFPTLDLDGDLAQFFLDPDDDGDGLDDVYETATGSFVSAIDTGTSPVMVDSDGDGFADGVEVLAGFDPTVVSSHPLAPLVPSMSLPIRLLLALLLLASGRFATSSRLSGGRSPC